MFLIPAPYYSSFVDDINERAGVLAVGVPCDETLSRDAFEQAYERVTGEGKRVRAVLFSSPNNPIGTVYKEEAIRSLLDFAMEHDLDVIRNADYIIDMGPSGGEAGGQIVAAGTPEENATNHASVTGRYLKRPVR